MCWSNREENTNEVKMTRNNKWDIRFMDMAKLVSTWSKDPSTQTGAVIVRPDRTIASVGFNGFPVGMTDTAERYADREQKYSRIVHCEMNALLHAGESVKGCTLYTFPFASCDRCCVHMLQAGIKDFVAPILPAHLEERWLESINKTKSYMLECGANFTEFYYV